MSYVNIVMLLTQEHKNNLLQRLPRFKLSYENIHKKVYEDLFYLIPYGPKYLVWFTYLEDKKVCVFIELNRGSKNFVKNIFISPQKFEKKMVLGTMFYGTVVKVGRKSFFTIENIHHYKGKSTEHLSEMDKLKTIHHILEHELVQHRNPTNQNICIGLPIITNTIEQAIEYADKSVYNIFSIQYRNLKNTTSKYCSTLFKNIHDTPVSNYDTNEVVYHPQNDNNKQQHPQNDNDKQQHPQNTTHRKLNDIVKAPNNHMKMTNKIFAVKADVQNDIYNLHCLDRDELVMYDIANIPTYSTSVMMNSIFRNIKENINLDALEESDDEDEFENINDDKFVKLDKCVYMECSFNKKHKQYVPIKVVSNTSIVSSKNELYAKQSSLKY